MYYKGKEECEKRTTCSWWDVLGGATKAITMLSSLKNPIFEVVSIEKKKMGFSVSSLFV